MNRGKRLFVSRLLVVAMVFLVAASLSGDAAVMAASGQPATKTERAELRSVLNQFIAKINDQDGSVVDVMTADGASSFFGSTDPDKVAEAIASANYTLVLRESTDFEVDRASKVATAHAAIAGLGGKHAFKTEQFSFVKQGGDYLISDITLAEPWESTKFELGKPVAITVTEDSATARTTSIPHSDVTVLSIANRCDCKISGQLYALPRGASIDDVRTHKVDVGSIYASQQYSPNTTHALMATGLKPGAYVVVILLYHEDTGKNTFLDGVKITVK